MKGGLGEMAWGKAWPCLGFAGGKIAMGGDYVKWEWDACRYEFTTLMRAFSAWFG